HSHSGPGHIHDHAHDHSGHDHSHGHSHAGHSHPPLRPSVLAWAMVATLGLVVAEVFGGFLGHSVALLNDAVHNLSDVPALGISLAVMRGHKDLNLRSILVHNFGDALSNIAIIAGAIAIHYTGLSWIDPVLGLAIGLLVLWSSIGILRASAHILLEGRPQNL